MEVNMLIKITTYLLWVERSIIAVELSVYITKITTKISKETILFLICYITHSFFFPQYFSNLNGRLSKYKQIY